MAFNDLSEHLLSLRLPSYRTNNLGAACSLHPMLELLADVHSKELAFLGEGFTIHINYFAGL